jgi:hypothetical protein
MPKAQKGDFLGVNKHAYSIDEGVSEMEGTDE